MIIMLYLYQLLSILLCADACVAYVLCYRIRLAYLSMLLLQNFVPDRRAMEHIAYCRAYQSIADDIRSQS